MPVIRHSFEHHAGDSTIWLGSIRILKEVPPGGGQGLLFPLHQPHKRTGGSAAIQSTPLPQKHYTFTNTHVFSGIQTNSTAVSITNR
ncbi:hypothetical protein TNCV_3235631 [Trichonephila clavipes]|nr:hypothetical protein TNCV_3235631 [Trichonephila clavipes]